MHRRLIRRYLHNVSDQNISSRRLDGGVQLITIDRPPVNALASDDWHLLQDHVLSAGVDTDVRCVVLTGTNRSFCAGADIRQLTEDAVATDGTTALRIVAETAAAIRTLRTPVIAAIDGAAHGGGLELALACDIRVCGSGSRFAMPEVSVGAVPTGGGTQRLPRAVGRAHALRMLLSAEPIDAADALRIGLVSEVVPDAEVDAAARAIADTIASRGPIATRFAKEAIHRGVDLPLAEGLTAELDLTVILQATQDRAEGVQAFVEKRLPRFENR
jgi:enoyl-CoA hydratase/carnithine racemase